MRSIFLYPLGNRHCAPAYLFEHHAFCFVVPLEAQSYGRPVIAFGKGESLETVVGAYSPISVRKTKGGEAITGVFFREQTADSVASAILSFESSEDMSVPEDIQLHARQFDTLVFV
jgi:glycosyltransferase involved in cell wall biosynthesis